VNGDRMATEYTGPFQKQRQRIRKIGMKDVFAEIGMNIENDGTTGSLIKLK
jgi:hypothetical protein